MSELESFGPSESSTNGSGGAYSSMLGRSYNIYFAFDPCVPILSSDQFGLQKMDAESDASETLGEI